MFNVDADGVAIQGYDSVAYFVAGGAVAGVPEFAEQYGGATFYFASENNRELFRSDPGKYAPAYGGWCAWAASRSSIADINPKAFVVRDDRLFLNFSRFLNWRFRLKLSSNIEKADTNWPDLTKEIL